MRKLALASLLCVAAVAPTVSLAQGLKNAQTVFTAGKWKVVRDIDKMTDKVDCTGIFNNDYSVQLTEDTLYMGFSGGLQGVTLRFDDQAPSPLRLANETEKKIRTVVISGREFVEALKSTRLLVQVSTLVGGVKMQEVDTTDMMAALDNIKAGCPIAATPITPKREVGAEQSVSGSCSPELIERMKKAKISASQIELACKG
ncbi:hypothetical protein [Ottowia thiooxydans]|uniref:APCDD1 domain-containing protein n=1 Tax=Ottowia thiooxydans TaxID=219182 RepID=A0ABV2Q1T0_9BURK